MRRAIAVLPGFSFLLLMSGCTSVPRRPVRERPNVLLIMSDDQGWGDLRIHGNDKIDTPVLDKLAGEGAQFDRFYVSPVCAPTRAALLTGRYSLRTGTHGVTRGWETFREHEVTIAEAFRDAGYATGCFGKWHNGSHYPHHPNGQGFGEFFGFLGGHLNLYDDPILQHNRGPVVTKGYVTDVLTDAALRFIDRNQDRPFFCYVPYNAPHGPMNVPDRWFNKFKARGLSDKNASVYGMCENLDGNVGRLLAKVEALGLSRRTIVLFLTDNGPNGSDRFNGSMRGSKGSVHEGGVRVPLFVRWPGVIQPGLSFSDLAAHIDLFPTLVDLAGIPMPKTLPIDGRSLAALLKGKGVDGPERMIFTNRQAGGRVSPQRGAVRTNRWRLVRDKKEWELYDMTTDPSEKRDVVADHPDLARRLTAAYDTWYADVTREGFDPVPASVGHAGWPVTYLPAHEATLEGKGIGYRRPPGYAHDWIAEWTNAEAHPRWDINPARGGWYIVSILYTCRKEDVGCRFQLEIGDKKLEFTVDQPFDPKPRIRPERGAKDQRYVKEWAEFQIGLTELTPGQTRLVLRAMSRPGEKLIDVKGIRITRAD